MFETRAMRVRLTVLMSPFSLLFNDNSCFNQILFVLILVCLVVILVSIYLATVILMVVMIVVIPSISITSSVISILLKRACFEGVFLWVCF